MWHGLGVVLDDYPEDAREAQRLAGLDWRVRTSPIFTKNVDGEVWIPEHFAVTRDDNNKVLAVVTNKYEPIQNSVLFDFIDRLLLLDKGAKFETAGSLKEGRVVWALTELTSQEFTIGDNDDLNKTYLLTTTSHDKSLAFQAVVTNVRVVCWNTLSLALGTTQNSWKIRHVGDVEDKVDDARMALKISFGWNREFREALEVLAREQTDDDLESKIVEALWPISEELLENKEENEEKVDRIMDKRGEINDLFLQVGEQDESIAGTKYAFLQAVTEQETWYPGFKEPTQRSVLWNGLVNDESSRGRKAFAYNMLIA
jgi:phage/plasmid-like protein (TIGR03299 family)